VNHPSRRQIKSERGLRIANLASTESSAGLQQARSGCSVDCSIDPAPAEKSLVGGIDDCVDPLLDDVAQLDFEIHHFQPSATQL
jgi:hypothetical protein